VTIQAIKILSYACKDDQNFLTQVFEKLKTVYDRVNKRLSGLFAIEFFQFLLDNHKHLIYDLEKSIVGFFESRLSVNFHNPMLVARLFLFLQQNHELILKIAPSIYRDLFPALLKPVAWFKNETIHIY